MKLDRVSYAGLFFSSAHFLRLRTRYTIRFQNPVRLLPPVELIPQIRVLRAIQVSSRSHPSNTISRIYLRFASLRHLFFFTRCWMRRGFFRFFGNLR